MTRIPTIKERPPTSVSALITKEVPEEYLDDADSIMKAKGWKYLKGAKDEPREGTDGFTYNYKRARWCSLTPLTSLLARLSQEGGSTPLGSNVCGQIQTHQIHTRVDFDGSGTQSVRAELGLAKNEWLRRLTPIELERLNMFPDNHTAGPTDGKEGVFHENAVGHWHHRKTRKGAFGGGLTPNALER